MLTLVVMELFCFSVADGVFRDVVAAGLKVETEDVGRGKRPERSLCDDAVALV
jgi:hypothetical protein